MRVGGAALLVEVGHDVVEQGVQPVAQRAKAHDDADADDAAMRPYSIAVAPDSSFTKRVRNDFMTALPSY